jgi:transcriptional regulator with XRE-family HTH domain
MDTARSTEQPTGLDLKLARIACGISQRELACRMGVSPQRVAAIEATRWPTPRMCERYAGSLAPVEGNRRGSSSAAGPRR